MGNCISTWFSCPNIIADNYARDDKFAYKRQSWSSSSSYETDSFSSDDETQWSIF